MWRDYSAGYIKNNRAAGISIMAAAFIATLFLSFLCSLFYNFWLDDIEKTILEEGGWQARITGNISEEQLAVIRGFANVEKAVANTELSDGQGLTVDIYFHNLRTTHRDMSLIRDTLGLEESAVSYNLQFLSLYFVRIPGDESPRLLMPLYLVIVAVVCFSMILVIHNSFAVSMNNRIRQFGILSSIGATPKQIRICLLQETMLLSAAPVLAGILSGIALCFGTMRGIDRLAANIVGSREAEFRYHPAVFAVTFLSAAFTILFSAWLPARKLSILTPLEAIRNAGELQLKQKSHFPWKNHSPILSALFGMEGELAGNALRAQRKALRTTSLSLTLSFLGFMMMQCFFALSDLSVRHTYFGRYQDAWDIMITVHNTGLEEFDPIQELQNLSGVQGAAAYQKADALCVIPKGDLSDELLALGGPEALAGTSVSVDENSTNNYLIKSPIVILDDSSFEEYCRQLGVAPDLEGGILLNRIWDSLHSNFRYREYLPYLREDKASSFLQDAGQTNKSIAIPLLACTRETPILREEYEDYALVHFIPLSLWEKIKPQISGDEKDTFVRLLAQENMDLNELTQLEKNAIRLIGDSYETESENRLQAQITNAEIIGAYKLVLGGFCILLALIGIANVFSNTLGFLRQRKREFARYLSVGLTPEGMRKIFCIEALAIAGRPVLITLPLTAAAVWFMISASHLKAAEFMEVAPFVPILLFILSVFGFVALAYYIGGKKILRLQLAEALRDNTLL